MPQPSKRRLFFDSYLPGLKTKWFVPDDTVKIKMPYCDIWKLNVHFALVSKQSVCTHILTSNSGIHLDRHIQNLSYVSLMMSEMKKSILILPFERMKLKNLILKCVCKYYCFIKLQDCHLLLHLFF